MNDITAQLELRSLHIPDRIDAPDAADFCEMVRVRNLVYREITGSDDDAARPDELLPHYRPSPDETRFSWLAVWDGTVVGRVGLDVPHEAGSDTAYWLIELLRDVHGRGIGSHAHALIERTAREHGRHVLQTYAEHPDQPGDRMAAPTGYGDIPRDHAARFLLRHGYTLEQINRKSVLDLPGSAAVVDEHLARAAVAAAGYRVVRWTVPTPPEFVEGYAWLKSRMSTDAPAAGLEVDEEEWDAARLARHDARYVEADQTLLVTAAQHIETGELAAFNELMISSDRTGATHQHDTLVAATHRGHRLGMLVKCAGLVAWREIAPGSPRVITYNAEENRPMLDINEALGFRPLSYEGAWKKRLSSGDAGSADSSAMTDW
ncbi:N-acetyltransferase [Microbacterium sp. AISO3]|jgi:GNAT superfamily N-acetyltransferase|uniref:GNAT superfamily N-acetyltransferase n=1 Tax=Microbacterium paludicola TaxID=300019 RepID=A0ABU1HZG9_9MICO|nr:MULTISPECIES: GNAT family N-acetyltransferase [Microbacterium]APF33415.1 N-acetyltransferase [Microbacterium paludicola]MDR6166263.1 GNAT superfamily N-acetyltransferase [Microbacterium paludicola]OWP22787.1 N-acetyltransferase [Microbacterium sp. AISO3]QCR40273.1 N-acetyltransferase [Microbacterium sp. SGAir0570]GAD33091.1 histone acetyltransferase HPA2 [Microbacterium sp. TS-1]